MSDEICYYVSTLFFTFHILSLYVPAMAPHESTALSMMSDCVGEEVRVIVIVCVCFFVYIFGCGTLGGSLSSVGGLSNCLSSFWLRILA